MLEFSLSTGILAGCLNDPNQATTTLLKYKSQLIAKDFEILLKTVINSQNC